MCWGYFEGDLGNGRAEDDRERVQCFIDRGLRGADFIKTSTGKVPVNATPETVYVICEALRQFHAQTGKMVGIKVAGGITKIQNAIRYLTIVKHILGEQWLTPAYFRIGTSQLLEDVLKEMKTVKLMAESESFQLIICQV